MIVAAKPLLIQLPDLPKFTSLSESTIKKEIREGDFPKPRQISGGRVGWLLREVEEWAENRPVSNSPPPPNTGNRKGKRKVKTTEQQPVPPASDQDE